jgi:hypothetical protein
LSQDMSGTGEPHRGLGRLFVRKGTRWPHLWIYDRTERRFRVLKENAEGTYKTKHAEAARLNYTTTTHRHTHTQTQAQTCTGLSKDRQNSPEDRTKEHYASSSGTDQWSYGAVYSITTFIGDISPPLQIRQVARLMEHDMQPARTIKPHAKEHTNYPVQKPNFRGHALTKREGRVLDLP